MLLAKEDITNPTVQNVAPMKTNSRKGYRSASHPVTTAETHNI